MNITVERINALIEETDLTVRELAEYAGCSKSAMQRYITGERDIPTSVINGLAEAFHVHPAYLFGWVDDRYYNIQETQPTLPNESELTADDNDINVLIQFYKGFSEEQRKELVSEAFRIWQK